MCTCNDDRLIANVDVDCNFSVFRLLRRPFFQCMELCLLAYCFIDSFIFSFLESMLMVDLRFAAVVVDNDMVCWSQERMCVCGTQFIFSLGS